MIGSRQVSVVVVGGGVGGLAVAGRLAMQQGLQVQILEKNTDVGGRLQSLSLSVSDECFRFDTGPSLLLLPEHYRDTYAALGEQLDDHITLKRVDPAAYRVHFAEKDGLSSLDLLYDVQAMCSQLEKVEKGASANYIRFLSKAKESLDKGIENFIARDFPTFGDYANFFRLLLLLKHLSPFELLGQHDLQMGHYFQDQRLRALFTFQDLYVGLSPYNAPGAFSLLAGTELTDGIWYPVGGFGRIRDSLKQIVAQLGVKILTGVAVKRINCDNGKVSSVSLEDGTCVQADIVVANADLPYVYDKLLSPQVGSFHKRSNKAKNYLYSAGVIAFNWALDIYVEGISHHNIFLSDSYKKSWNHARDPQSLLERPNFYLHAPTRTDPSASPPGKDALTVLLPVANLKEGYCGDEEMISAARRTILDRLRCAGFGDLGPHILKEVVYCPPDWQEMYNLQYGAAFGLAHNLGQLAYFRPDVRDPDTKGLYFVGASTRPGNGVPLVLIGAKTTAERILKDLPTSSKM